MSAQRKKDICFGKELAEMYVAKSDPRVGGEGPFGMKTYGVQKKLFEYLGSKKYKHFCTVFAQQNPGKQKECYFNPRFSPTNPETILHDSSIEFWWGGLDKIFKAVYACL